MNPIPMPTPTPADYQLLEAVSAAISIVQAIDSVVLNVIGAGIGFFIVGLIAVALRDVFGDR